MDTLVLHRRRSAERRPSELLHIDGETIALTNGNSATTAANSYDLSVSVTAGTATVTISKVGGYSTANAQSLLNALAYENTSQDPLGANRTVTLTSIKDTGGTANSGVDTTAVSIASTVTMAAANDAPTLSATGDSPTFTEGGAAAGLYSAASIGLTEAADLVDTITFTVAGLQNGADELLHVDGETIALTNGNSATTAANSYDLNVTVAAGTATVTISKVGGYSTAAAQTVVDGLGYENTSDDPLGANRTVTLTSIQDTGGTANSGVDTTAVSIGSTVTMAAVNDAPTMSATGDSPTFTEGGAAAGLYSSTNIGLTEAADLVDTITFTVAGLQNGADELLHVDGETIALTNGNSATTAANSYDLNVTVAAGTATVTISKVGGYSTAAAQTVVDGLGYENTSDDPLGANRTVTLTSIQDTGGTANSGVDTTAVSIGSTVTMAAVNDAPTMSATGDSPTFTEGGAAAGLYSSTSIGLTEAADLVDTITFTVAGLQNGADELLHIDGETIALTNGNSTTTAANSYDLNVTVAAGTATVTVSKVGGYTTPAAQTVVDGLGYENTSDDPLGVNRTVTLTSIQDTGGTANSGVDTTAVSIGSTVTMAAVNDAPTMSATGDSPTFTEGGAAAGLYSSTSIGLTEAADLVDTITFTVAGLQNGADELLHVDGETIALTNGNSATTAANSYDLNVTVAAGTATVTISKVGGYSTAAAQTVVDGLGYENTSDDPLGANRTVTLTSIQDTGGTANSGVDTTAVSLGSTITMAAVNDAPTMSATGDSPTFTEGGAAAGLYSSTSIGLTEAADLVDTITFTVAGLQNGADELLHVDGETIALTNGNSATTAANSYDLNVTVAAGTATVTISKVGGYSSAAAQMVVDGLGYENTSDDPLGANRTVTLTSIQDTGGTANSGVDTTAVSIGSTVTMAAVNDAPTMSATGDSPTFTEGGAAAGLYSSTSIGLTEAADLVDTITFTVAGLQNGADELLHVDGETIALTNGNSATTVANSYDINVTVAAGTATVTISKVGGYSTAAAQTVVDGLGYENTSDDPLGANRSVTLTSIQDTGGTANSGVDTTAVSIGSTVTMAAVNDAPTMSATGDSPTFTEGGAAAGLYSSTSIGLTEVADLVDTITFTVAGLQNGADELLHVDGETIALTNGNSATTAANSYDLNVTVAAGTATVTISKVGGYSTAAAQTVVDGLGYENTSDDPLGANRTVTLTSIQDTGGTANSGVDTTAVSLGSTVTMAAVNDAPTMSATGDSPTFTEGGAAAGLYSSTSIGLTEVADLVDTITFTVAGLQNGADELLHVDGETIALTNGNSATTAANSYDINVTVAAGTSHRHHF